jgi:hypothetical protein
VTARPSTKHEQDALDIRPEDWVMILTRVLRTSGGTPIEATVIDGVFLVDLHSAGTRVAGLEWLGMPVGCPASTV